MLDTEVFDGHRRLLFDVAYLSVLLFKRGLQADSRNDAREALKRDPQNELANLVLTKLSSW